MTATRITSKLRKKTKRMTKSIKVMTIKAATSHYCVKNVRKIIVLTIIFLH
jgi:hypothetical protein